MKIALISVISLACILGLVLADGYSSYGYGGGYGFGSSYGYGKSVIPVPVYGGKGGAGGLGNGGLLAFIGLLFFLMLLFPMSANNGGSITVVNTNSTG